MPRKPKDELDLAVALLDAKLTMIAEQVREMQSIIRGEYIRRDEFAPVKQVVFGLVATVLLAVIGSLVTLVLR